MIRNIFIFLATFAAGALIALVVRSALFKPHAEHVGHPAGGGDYASMVTNTLAPAETTGADAKDASANPPAADPHANHGATTSSDTAANQPVNTVCAICGMEVDPKIATAQYNGVTIGFGCKMCPPKFRADPDRWGPLYLRNEVAKQ